jgi:hypothetical protein
MPFVSGQKATIDSPNLINATSLDEYTVLLTWKEPLDNSLIENYIIYRDDGTGFDAVGKEPVNSTSFYDFGLKPDLSYSYYITSFSSTEESAPSNILTILPTAKSFPEPPMIIELKSSGIDEITVIWEEPTDTKNIVSYEIERRIQDKEEFLKIASVKVGTTDYIDTKLTVGTVYSYRILSMDDLGQLGIPSNVFSGVSSIDLTTLDSVGKTVEPDPANTFSTFDVDIIAQTIELFNVNTNSMDLIILDIKQSKLNAYEIITKMSDGSYDATDEMKNAGAFYGSIYLESNDISKFISIIQEETRIAVDGSSGLGVN